MAHYWTTFEIRMLSQIYRQLSPADLEKAFPRHSLASIRSTASANGFAPKYRKYNWVAICAAHKPTFNLSGAPK